MKYKYVKQIKSTTKVEAHHVRVDDINYQILISPIPRYYTQVSAYIANERGKDIDLLKPLFKTRGDKLEDGVECLMNHLKGTEI